MGRVSECLRPADGAGPNERHKMQRQKLSSLLKNESTDGVNSNEEIKRGEPYGPMICTTNHTHGF